MYCADDDHSYVAHYCDVCGKFQGMSCEYCGAWCDGGDHMAAQPELWCACEHVYEVSDDD